MALALGGNLPGRRGPVRRQLRRALERLDTLLGPLRVAPLYRTTPVSPIPQPDYLNTAAVGTTGVPPRRILRLAKELEREAGRDFAAPRDAPRPLDVDLLLWGDLVLREEGLEVPHPRLRERGFVLVPLCEVGAELRVPPEGVTVRELLERLRQRGAVGGVRRVEWEDVGNGNGNGNGNDP